MISAASSLTASSTAALTTPAVAAHSHPRGVPRRMITLLRSVGTKAAGTVSGTRGSSCSSWSRSGGRGHQHRVNELHGRVPGLHATADYGRVVNHQHVTTDGDLDIHALDGRVGAGDVVGCHLSRPHGEVTDRR